MVWVGAYFLLIAAVFGFALLNWGWRGHSFEFVFIATGFAGSAAVASLLIVSQHWHGHLSMDHKLDGIQKSHTTPVPRIGGLAIFAGVCLSAGLLLAFGSLENRPRWAEFGTGLGLLVLCGMPAFVVGMWEDLTKRVSVLARLVATFLSAGLAAWLMDAVLPRVDVPGVDVAMAWMPFALAVTVFAVAGVSNAVNIIDGFNGLASGVMVLLGLGFAGFAVLNDDVLILVLALTLSAVAAGFMLLNFPHGRIFLGDGGAYFLGFYLAEMAVLTSARHANMSAWTILTLLSYPVVEVVVSIVRRKIKKMSPGQPDRGHLHQQLQAFLQRYYGGKGGGAVYIVNPQVSPFIWVLVCLNIALAFACSGSVASSVAGFCISALVYLLLYGLLVMFNHRSTTQSRISSGVKHTH